jgi:hypothetical protein
MRRVCCIEGGLTSRCFLFDATVMNVGGCQQRYAAMPMLVVVPGVKRAAERSCFDDVGEGRWELRLIFRRFEQRFDVRVVIRYMRT